MNRVAVKPEMLRWARERAGQSVESLAKRFSKLAEWEAGERKPTLKQLERFAKAVHLPLGYLFLSEPPVERIPIPDLRTIGGERLGRASPDLLDTVHLCQRRQAWYRDWVRSTGGEPCGFVGSTTLNVPADEAAASMRTALGFELEARQSCSRWVDALRLFIQEAEELGVLVMVSGIVASNTRRKLDPEEFRGFALADEWAPLVFINAADTKAAQIFTLAHELAHLWLGESALTDVGPASSVTREIEIWCNQVTAELLVPLREFREALTALEGEDRLQQLARRFKVSTLVILRRLLDAGEFDRDSFQHAYDTELAFLREIPRSTGGNFYPTQSLRLSRRFARAVVVSTLEGGTLYRDAFQMLGVRKHNTFRELGSQLGLST